MALTSKALLQPIALGLCLSLAQAQSIPSGLDLSIVQGEGAINRIRRRAESPPVVRVEDQDKRPVAGAVVMFTLPTEGATGDFNGQKTTIVTTGADGIATAKALKLNDVPGKVPIHVSASYRGLTARAIVNQTTVAAAGDKPRSARDGRGHGALIAVLVGLAAAGGGGAAYALSQKKQAAPSGGGQPTPVTPAGIGITPGTGSIAGGH